MLHTQQIFERKEILPYLESRGLLKQYQKTKRYLLHGKTLQLKFKERNPKGSGIMIRRLQTRNTPKILDFPYKRERENLVFKDQYVYNTRINYIE